MFRHVSVFFFFEVFGLVLEALRFGMGEFGCRVFGIAVASFLVSGWGCEGVRFQACIAFVIRARVSGWVPPWTFSLCGSGMDALKTDARVTL